MYRIEANANRYTFIWRGSINYHLAGLLDSIDVEGMDKVREVIEKNRSRKLTKHKKLSNNTLIEIDSCSPLEILKLQTNLTKIANGEGISFEAGKGKRKPPI